MCKGLELSNTFKVLKHKLKKSAIPLGDPSVCVIKAKENSHTKLLLN